MSDDAWARKMVELYSESDPETFARLMLYLADNGKHQMPLNKLARVEQAFTVYAHNVLSEVGGTLAQYLDQDQIVSDGHGGFELKSDGMKPGTMLSVTGLWTLEKLPVSIQSIVSDAIVKTLSHSNSQTVKSLSGALVELPVDKLMRYVKCRKGALMGVHLSLEAITSINQWWTGKISGKRTAKRVVDCAGSLGGGFFAGEVGFIVGSHAAGPLGGLGGAVVGGLAGAWAAGSFADQLTQWMFDVPKDVALEKGYEFLGVSHSSDNHAVNKQFRQRCLKLHPDKGGNAEDFYKLQISMHIIRLARDEAREGMTQQVATGF